MSYLKLKLKDCLVLPEQNYDAAWNRAMAMLTNGGELKFPAEKMRFTRDAVCDNSDLKMKGVGASSNLVFETGGLIFGKNKKVNRVSLKGVSLSSANRTGVALCLNPFKNNEVTDSEFKKIYITNYQIGIESDFSWCNTFEKVRVQNVDKPLSLNSQTNNTAFIRCNFCVSKLKSSFINCLGIGFYECGFEQSEDGVATLYQSSATFISPYFEENGDVDICVGSINEEVDSRLTIIGGFGLKNILCKMKDNVMVLNMQSDYEVSLLSA